MKRSILALLFSLLIWPVSAQLSGGLIFPGPGTAHSTGPASPSISFQALTSDVSNSTTYTFTSAALGPADATRAILVCVMGSNGGLAAPTVTVAGNSAAAQTTAVIGASNTTAALYSVAVASGTTGTIVVTWSTGQVRTSIAVWATYHLSSATAVSSATSTSATANLNLTLLSGDVVAVCGESGTGTSATATGYTSRFNTTDAEGEAYSGGDFTASINESPRTITMTWNGTTIYSSLSANFR